MRKYSGRTGIKRWLYTYEDPILIIVFLGAPAIIFVLTMLYILWRY